MSFHISKKDDYFVLHIKPYSLYSLKQKDLSKLKEIVSNLIGGSIIEFINDNYHTQGTCLYKNQQSVYYQIDL